MKNKEKTTEQPINELAELRQRVTELEALEAERGRAEERIEHLNAVLRAIRNVNQLVVQERDRDRLVQGACDTLIETRGYHDAWIVLLDEAGGLVTTGEAGLGEAFWPMVERLKRGELPVCGQRALSQPGIVVTKDPPSTCANCPLSGKSSGRGAVTVRLEHGRKVYGLLSASILADFISDEEEEALFAEVAGDIAFALHGIELEEEHKRAEEALRESEEHYRTIIENANDMIWVLDTRGNFTVFNRQAEVISGQKLKDWKGKSFAPLIHPDDLEMVGEVFQKTLSGEPQQYTVRVYKKDGEIIILSVNTAPVYEKGEIVGTVSFGRDITEQVRAEETLKHRMQQLTALGQASQAVTASLELDHVLAEVVSLASAVVASDYTSVVLVDEAGQMGQSTENVPGVPAIVYRVRDEGLTSWIIRSRQPVVVDEIGEGGAISPNLGEGAPRFANPHIVEAGIRSVAGLPLMVKTNLLGVIFMHSLRPGNFRDQLFLLTTFANQAAVAIENARLYERERQRVAQRARMLKLSYELRLSLELPETLNRICRAIVEELGWQQAILSLRDYETKTSRPVAMAGYDAETTTRTLALPPAPFEELNILRQEFRISHSYYINHQHREAIADYPDELVVTALAPGIKPGGWHQDDILLVPVEGREGILGFISPDNPVNRQRPTLETVQELEIFANQAAVAIENARLFGETHRRVAHQEALNTIIAAGVAATNLPELLETALDQTLQALGLEIGGVWLKNHIALRGVPPEMNARAARIAAEVGMDMRAPRAVDDWQQAEIDGRWSVVAPLAASLGIRAALTVPISIEGSPIGGLCVAAPSPRSWSPEEVALVETVGRQLGGAAERLRLLERIHEQAHQVQQIIRTVPEGVLLLDANLRVLRANPAAQEYLVVLADAEMGDTLTHLGGRPLADLLTSPSKRLWHEVKVDDPPRRVFEVIAQPMEAGLATGGWVLVIRDVTRERETRQRAQQQERLASVGQLAAGIAHDFNNIMAVIVLYTQMALRAADVPPKVRERLATVSQQAKRATDLIQQILDFSRRAMLKRQPLNLVPFLKEQVKLLERTLPENIKINLAYGPVLTPVEGARPEPVEGARPEPVEGARPEPVEGSDEYTVNADLTRIQQAMMNLALNARDAMPEGGELCIGLERIRLQPGEPPPLSEMSSGEWIRVTMADSGTGIPPDVLPHIFEPFFTTRAPLGSGLGLAQVYGIVKQHEGHLDVTTQVGVGTTFIIYLPALPIARIEEMATERPALAEGHGEIVLVVEDDMATRKALRAALEELNYQVLETTNGQEALTVFEQHGGAPSTGASRAESRDSEQGIALVLSDLVMPEMSGMALLRALRQRGLTVPMVVLTGYSLQEEAEDLQAQGVADWIQKPVNLEQLAEVVARALRSRPPTSSPGVIR